MLLVLGANVHNLLNVGTDAVGELCLPHALLLRGHHAAGALLHTGIFELNVDRVLDIEGEGQILKKWIRLEIGSIGT